MQEVYSMIEKLVNLETRYSEGKELSLTEIDILGLYLEKANIHLLNEDFRTYKFKKIYSKYYEDLSFKGYYFYKNPEKNLSEFVSLEYLKQRNENEYNQDDHLKFKQILIDNKLLIPVSDLDKNKDEEYLDKIADEWAQVCLNERHSEEEYKIIAKETRDTIKNGNKKNIRKVNIRKYLNNDLSNEERLDVFKVLLKSYYMFCESHKIFERIKNKNEPFLYEINSQTFEYNFYSSIHILNRHFAEIVSSESITSNKSFHTPKILPYEINLFIDNLFSKINSKEISSNIDINSNTPILFNYHQVDYAIFFSRYKYDNTKKIVVETFYPIDEAIEEAEELLKRIENSQKINLDDNLELYISK